MNKFGEVFCLAGFFALVLAATAAWSQVGMGHGGAYGRVSDADQPRKYDPKTVETLRGEVLDLGKVTSGRRISSGVHVTLKTEKETILVLLGPSWYIEKQAMTIASGDKVEVTGSRITHKGQPAIIAAEVKKGGQVLKLRDASGVPAWAGAGQGPLRR